MPPTYAQNKVHIYNWRLKNRDFRNFTEARNKRWRTIKKEFLQILII
jgi:hypothetical protein